MTKRILIIEDDVDIQNFLSTALKDVSYQVFSYSNGEDALSEFDTNQPDLVLLDVQLPGINGYEICAEIRTFSNIPIIFVSCLADGSDIVRGLELGGDDYVTKPFDLFVLIARIQSNLRRAPSFITTKFASNQLDSETYTVDTLRFHIHSGKVFVDNTLLRLSTKEFQIFFFLAQHPEQTFHPSELYQLIWEEDSIGQTQALKVHISNLRRKLESTPGHTAKISTVRGFGYQLQFDVILEKGI